MTNTVPNNLHFEGPSEIMDEEVFIDSIISKIHAADRDNSDLVIQDIKNDLLVLRQKFGESDFKTRYFNSRERAIQQFIDNFPSMLGYWNKELKSVHSNNAYARYFGKDPADIRGRTMVDLLGKKIFEMNLPYIKGVLGGTPQTFERDIPTPSGQVKNTLANYVPHLVNDEVIGFFVIVTDISEKKRLEEKAKILETSLYEQSRLSSLGQMASSIAHEINNPLSIIYSDACLLLKELKKENSDSIFIHERLTEIADTSLRIEKIVDGLRSLNVGRSVASIHSCNLVQIVDQVLAICSNRFLKAGFKINWIAPEAEILSLCNEFQVSEILLNILNNAFDELKKVENGQVGIKVLKTAGRCEVRISNNGPEIKIPERKNLFIPFYSTKGKGGTGLGLKISRDLARSNGGELKLSESADTEFILSLQEGAKGA